MRELNGEPDIIQIRKIFETKTQVLDWERKVLERLDVSNKDRWLNIIPNNHEGLTNEEVQAIHRRKYWKIPGIKEWFVSRPKKLTPEELRIKKSKAFYEKVDSPEWRQERSNIAKAKCADPVWMAWRNSLIKRNTYIIENLYNLTTFNCNNITKYCIDNEFRLSCLLNTVPGGSKTSYNGLRIRKIDDNTPHRKTLAGFMIETPTSVIVISDFPLFCKTNDITTDQLRSTAAWYRCNMKPKYINGFRLIDRVYV
jgi:hypothetical protein